MPHSNRHYFQHFLDRLTKRSALSAQEREAVLSLPGEVAKVPSNRDFVRLGDQLDHSCLIVSGYVGRFDQNANGVRQITALHVLGDMADLHSVVQPEATSALQALSPSTIIRVPHDAVRKAAANFPAIAEALWRDCMVDASVLSQWVVNVGRRNARSRIAHLVCEIATRLGVAPAEGELIFPFPVTQFQLGDVTGLTSIHVNRTLQALRRDGILELRHNAHIFDWDNLVREGEFDPAYLQLAVRPQRRLPFGMVAHNGIGALVTN